MDKRTMIQAAVSGYFDGLEKKDFDLIPYADNVSLRAPLAPGGVNHPLVGREAGRSGWWQPLPSLLGEVTPLGIYFDEDLTGAIAEGVVEILLEPRVLLRVADRFTIDDDGRITEQENHFDPRDVTNPGWTEAPPASARNIAEQFYEAIAHGDVSSVLGLLDDGRRRQAFLTRAYTRVPRQSWTVCSSV